MRLCVKRILDRLVTVLGLVLVVLGCLYGFSVETLNSAGSPSLAFPSFAQRFNNKTS